MAEVQGEPDTDYRLSAWIKTRDVRNVRNGRGAQLNVHATAGQPRTDAVVGTSDWRRVEITFNSGNLDRISVNCLFGGWGLSTGTAWFDDVELVKQPPTGLPGAVGKVVGIVVNAYAKRGDAATIVPTLSALKNSQPALTTVVIESLSKGWPEGRAPTLSEADVAELRAVMTALPPAARDRLLVLSQRWGQGDLFAEQRQAIMADLGKALADASLSPARRTAAAAQLVAVDAGDAAVNTVLKQIGPKAAPALQAELIEALSGSPNPKLGTILIGKWNTITPSAQKVAIGVLLRNEAWARSLLDAVEKGTVSNKDLAPEHWQALTALPDERLARRAGRLRQATGRAPSGDRKTMIEKLLPLATKAGDVEVGRAVYAKNCAVCHAIEGQGGKVGPELTGIGARPRQDILLEVIDPNRSVEGTYRAWLVKTKKEVLSGRLASESQTSVELIDTAGKVHVISRDEIQALKASELSVMPEGFENLPPEELSSLVEFLATSRVKH